MSSFELLTNFSSHIINDELMYFHNPAVFYDFKNNSAELSNQKLPAYYYKQEIYYKWFLTSQLQCTQSKRKCLKCV
jgi:hypothetical protein